MLNLVVQTAPAIEPVTVGEVLNHARIDYVLDELLIEQYITTARDMAERHTGRAFITTTYDFYLDTWPAGEAIILPRAPVASVGALDWFDDADAATTVAASTYYVRAATTTNPGAVVLRAAASWPTGTLRVADGVRVRFTAGYGATRASVPAAIRTAIMMWAADLYENPENTVVQPGVSAIEVPMGAARLLAPYRLPYNRRMGVT